MTVVTPSRPATPDELVSVTTSATGRTSRRKRPAALLAEQAAALGWTVHGPWLARGPVTIGRRQDEPNADGVRPTIQATTVEDTYAVRLEDASGRRLTALWSPAGVECRAWTACTHPLGRCPRLDDERVACNMRALSLAELKQIVEQGPRTEGEEAMSEETERANRIDEIAREQFVEWIEDNENADLCEAFSAGYWTGTVHTAAEYGDAYGEGYAAGLAAVAGRAQVWVKTRKRLDALRPGDVILGKGDRWWIVEWTASSGGIGGRAWNVTAYSGAEALTVSSNGARKVDVVESIATADALAALKDGELGAAPLPIESEVA